MQDLQKSKKYELEYEQLTLTNQFMFGKVMQNKRLCTKLLEVVLDKEIEDIQYVEVEKTIDLKPDSHGIRLDAYVKDNKRTIYNVEMQATDTKNLPKRSRYYQGLIDLNLLSRGTSYKRLNRSYVIFICMFDVFGKGRHVYTFDNYCEQDKELCLGDEATKIFINPFSDMDDVDEELSNFLHYLVDGNPTDEFTNELNEEVVKVRENKEWRLEYVTLSMRLDELREEAWEQGLEQGLERGLERGLQQGKMELTIVWLADGTVSMEKAMEQTGLTEAELIKAVEAYKEKNSNCNES